MIFKFLGGPIINKVVSTGVRYFEKRQEISEAKHTARLEIEAKKATADIDWDAAAMEASKGSWKDELWTIWIIGVLTALLIPQSQPHVISTLSYPKSKHNRQPSLAADVIPYPVDWEDSKRFYHFAGFVEGIAAAKGIKIRWGGDWDGDRSFADQNFHDLPHFELG